MFQYYSVILTKEIWHFLRTHIDECVATSYVVMARSVHCLEKTIKNDILCYISTSRHFLTIDSIVINTIGFYKSDAILKAGETIYGLSKERLITRKTCASHPNPNVADIHDILGLFEKMEKARHQLPDFVATNYNSLPPANFEALAGVICSFRDEVSALILGISQVRESNVKDVKAMEDICCVNQDIADIKSKVCFIKYIIYIYSNMGEQSNKEIFNNNQSLLQRRRQKIFQGGAKMNIYI